MIKGITMKKFTALSTAALLAIFLTACDKPASQTTEAATPAKETAAASTPAKETATPAPAKEAAPAPKADTGEQDYKHSANGKLNKNVQLTLHLKKR